MPPGLDPLRNAINSRFVTWALLRYSALEASVFSNQLVHLDL